MWKKVNGRLIQEIDETRVKFRTNISKSIIAQLNELADEHDTHANYLIENGLQHVLADGSITFDKKTRPKDRIQYKTTYDKELLNYVKEFAQKHQLFINDVIEYSTKYIDLEHIKSKDYRYRVE
ncbi:rRNA methyltransferase [Niallia nealsonii]|uniref:rRNA methyltransferase n=1 Tax=Niallia nealsonii TaxID=115979 RepID=A0A2N0Z0E3_9BACI|nr:rRNA methyltransferase [Niallia nealsonii]PKG22969.1 rRNA methyltransferase [Niallia nealsonii]